LNGFNTFSGGAKTGGRNRTEAEKQHLSVKAQEWQAKRECYGTEIGDKLKAFYATEKGKQQLATRQATANKPEVRLAMSKAHGGKPVEVYLQGSHVATYNTQGECAKALQISQGNLNSCLLGRAGAKSLRGYTFKFATIGVQVLAGT
jgi:hypothetical protein